jgi:hypothetical protein
MRRMPDQMIQRSAPTPFSELTQPGFDAKNG